jgi:hypothetical protein
MWQPNLYKVGKKIKNENIKEIMGVKGKPDIIDIIIITPWPQSASELYRQNGRRRSAKVVPTVSG